MIADRIGEATDHDELLAVLRKRKAALQLSDAIVDELAGMAAGHTGKLLGPAPVKTLGAVSLSALLSVLALRLIIVEDTEQAARIGRRWQRRTERAVSAAGSRRIRCGTRSPRTCWRAISTCG